MHEHETLMEVHRALGRLEGKLDSLLTQATSDRSELEKLRSRLGKLEHWRNWLSGAYAATVIIGGILLKLVN